MKLLKKITKRSKNDDLLVKMVYFRKYTKFLSKWLKMGLCLDEFMKLIMISKKHLSLFFLLMVNLCIAQKETWTLDPENSFISYDAKHILHSWKGMNTNVKGIAKVEANKINQIAILTLVKDFDSNNSGRDAHALEVLQSLSYPEVRFYSDSITVAQDSIKITGLFNFHGVNQSRSIAALIENEKNKKIIRGSFKLTPSDFDIKLPSLMMVKMENLLLFNFKLEFIK